MLGIECFLFVHQFWTQGEGAKASPAVRLGELFAEYCNPISLAKQAGQWAQKKWTKIRQSSIDKTFGNLSIKGKANDPHLFNIYENIGQDSGLEELHTFLVDQFKEIKATKKAWAWIQQQDILDAIDKIHELYPELALIALDEPIEGSKTTTREKGAAYPIPLRSVKAIDKLQQQILQAENSGAGLESQYEELLTKYAEKEKTNVSSWIERSTSKRPLGTQMCTQEWFTRYLTYRLGQKYHKKADPKEIAEISLKLGITPYEVVKEHVVTRDKSERCFFLRGPRYTFGKRLREFETVDEWFVRDLSEDAREEFARAAEYKGLSYIAKGYCTASPVVSSHANCRLYTKAILPEQMGHPFLIKGKVLNDAAVEKSKRNKDSAAYPEDRYYFSPKNLFGREESDTVMMTSSDTLKKYDTSVQKFINENKTEMETLRAKLDPSSQVPDDIKKIRQERTNHEKFFKKKMGQIEPMLKLCQHELAGSLYRLLNREGAQMVVERLAPEDLHNYAAAKGGKILSFAEICDRLHGENVPDEEKKALTELKEIFEKQKEILGRDPQNSIDFYGTNKSVASPSVDNQPNTLAQNDRKLLVIEHDNGALEVLFLIGATGVNRVEKKEKSSISLSQGEQLGSMGFGPDVYPLAVDNQEIYFSSQGTTTRDGIGKLQTGEIASEKKRAQKLGGFTIDGSTCISFYVGKRYVPTRKVAQFSQVSAKRGNSLLQEELRVQLGDPILIEREVALVKSLEEKIGKKQFLECEKLNFNDIKEKYPTLINDLDKSSQQRFLTSLQSRCARLQAIDSLDKQDLVKSIQNSDNESLETLRELLQKSPEQLTAEEQIHLYKALKDIRKLLD